MRTSVRRLLIVLSVLLVAACGDDDTAPLDTPPPTTESSTTDAGSTTPGTAAPGGEYEYATGADDVVIKVGYEGGFVPAASLFAATPLGLITGDGLALTTGPTTMQFPGQLLPNLRQQSITPTGIEQLLAEADGLGLLADVEYQQPDNIADAPTTVVTITVAGTTYDHAAYALDLGPETDPARQALSEFVAMMTDLAGTVGDELGQDEPYVAAAYLIQAEAVDLATMTFDVEPTVVDWPADAPVELSAAGECVEVPAEFGDAVFSDATQLTFFAEADVTYRVAVVPAFPGRTC